MQITELIAHLTKIKEHIGIDAEVQLYSGAFNIPIDDILIGYDKDSGKQNHGDGKTYQETKSIKKFTGIIKF
jgi:hypothetical protein